LKSSATLVKTCSE